MEMQQFFIRIKANEPSALTYAKLILAATRPIEYLKKENFGRN